MFSLFWFLFDPIVFSKHLPTTGEASSQSREHQCKDLQRGRQVVNLILVLTLGTNCITLIILIKLHHTDHIDHTDHTASHCITLHHTVSHCITLYHTDDHRRPFAQPARQDQGNGEVDGVQVFYFVCFYHITRGAGFHLFFFFFFQYTWGAGARRGVCCGPIERSTGCHIMIMLDLPTWRTAK